MRKEKNQPEKAQVVEDVAADEEEDSAGREDITVKRRKSMT